MTNQEVYDYIKNVDEHLSGNKEYIADQYVKEGLGQICGRYFIEAYKKDKEIRKSSAEPSQKWHLMHAYFDVKKDSKDNYMQENASLGRIMCPQLMLWIAEIAELDKEILIKAKNEASEYEIEYNTKDSRKIKSKVLNEKLYWNEIIQSIREEKSWSAVIKRVEKIGN